MDDTWTVAKAKARLSELLEHAEAGRPQVITRHGRIAAVVVSAEEWQRKTRRTGTLAEFFGSSPLAGSDVRVERLPDGPRPHAL